MRRDQREELLLERLCDMPLLKADRIPLETAALGYPREDAGFIEAGLHALSRENSCHEIHHPAHALRIAPRESSA